MSDPRSVAHAKKVRQEKKHHGADEKPAVTAAQPGKKQAKTNSHSAGATTVPDGKPAAGETAVPSETPMARSPAALEEALVLLAKLLSARSILRSMPSRRSSRH